MMFKDNFRIFLLLLLSTLIPFILIEFILKIVNYPYQGCKTITKSAEYELGKFDEITGWSYKNDLSYLSKRKDFSYYFNDKGIRVRAEKLSVDFNKPRIVFIGGSVTFGEELNYDQIFSSQINSLLDNKYEIVNLGVQGFGSVQSMLQLDKYIEYIKPDFVVYTFIPDHLRRDVNHDRRLHYKCFEYAGTKPVFSVLDGELKQLMYPQKYSYTDKIKLFLFINNSYHLFRENNLLTDGSGIEVTKKVIDQMNLLSDNVKAKQYFIFYDTVYDNSKDGWNDELYRNLFSNKYENKTLKFYNWAQDSELIGKKYFVNDNDDYHPNASLSAVLAEEFIKKFKIDFDF
ncbi:MAG: hypothetical protein OEX81_01830 [Candidatus Pacebacteria bacterium]|nr:hypothetical protein [Candidatus Paceibacterota bacterium]